MVFSILIYVLYIVNERYLYKKSSILIFDIYSVEISQCVCGACKFFLSELGKKNCSRFHMGSSECLDFEDKNINTLEHFLKLIAHQACAKKNMLI